MHWNQHSHLYMDPKRCCTLGVYSCCKNLWVLVEYSHVDSMAPGDAIWCHWTCSTYVQVTTVHVWTTSRTNAAYNIKTVSSVIQILIHVVDDVNWNSGATGTSLVQCSLNHIIDTVETLYSTIPYTTIFGITRWAHGPQNLQRPIRTLIVIIRSLNKTNFHVICLFTAHVVDSEWTHMWPAASVNNDGRTDYLRLSHLTALPAGVNNHLRCIHKGLTAFSRVTPPIQMTIKQFLTRSFDSRYKHLTPAEVGSRSY